MQKTKLLLVCGSAVLLAACGTRPVGSVIGGECRVAHAPQYVVKGKTAHDQEWIDDTTEGLVAGCKQPRPKARPKEWDTYTVSGKTVPVPTPPKKRWYDRFRKTTS